jgi:hypothetical protein
MNELPSLWRFAAEHAPCILTSGDALWLGPWEAHGTDGAALTVECRHCGERAFAPLAVVSNVLEPVLWEQFEQSARAAHPGVFTDPSALQTWRLRVCQAWQWSCARTWQILRTPTSTAH